MAYKKTIILDGSLDNLEEDCTYAKIYSDDSIALKQYDFTTKKTVSIYLTKEELLKLVNQI